jgi:glycosyltransferase involved in cell wall biosynthesis
MKKSVAIVYETTFPEFKGGIERWFLELSKGLVDEDIEITYLNLSHKNININGVNFVSLKSSENLFISSGKRNISNIANYGLSVFRHFYSNPYDIIYLTSFPYIHLFAAKLACVIRKRDTTIICEWFEILSFHYWKSRYGLVLGILGYLNQTLFIKISDFNLLYLQSTFLDAKRKSRRNQKIILLPGICPVARLDEPNPIFKESVDICQLGRLIDDKQPLLGVNVAGKLKELGWKGKFYIIGDGPLKEEVIDCIDKLELTNTVKVLNNLNDQEVQEVLKSSSVLFHPSKREGYGLAVIEAAMLGVPAVLISYKDNKSVELAISPSLVSNSSEIDELARIILFSFKNREDLHSRCLEWKSNEAVTKTTVQSIDKIADLIKNVI